MNGRFSIIGGAHTWAAPPKVYAYAYVRGYCANIVKFEQRHQSLLRSGGVVNPVQEIFDSNRKKFQIFQKNFSIF